MNPVSIHGQTASIDFRHFDLESYKLFLRCKQLPESSLSYDVESDSYTLTTARRFANLLGAAEDAGEVEVLPLAEHLFDYQRFIVSQALNSRRYAIYADTGLGKTCMFLEYARHVVTRTGGRVLILSPLQIIPQTIEEARRFYGDAMPVHQLGSREELIAWCQSGSGVAITNYEKLSPGIINEFRLLAGLVLDESSILKSGGGVIKWNLIKSARGIEYKLSCTATPAPNDIMEYASQASFLEKLRTEGEILWTFFTRDKRGVWKVKPHALEGFYRFMSSWSIYLRNPAHYGWGDTLATLPPPVFHEHRIDATPEQLAVVREIRIERGKGLFGSERLGITERSTMSQIAKGFRYLKDGRATVQKKRQVERVDSLKPHFVAGLIRGERAAGRQVLVWTVFDEESEVLLELLNDSSGVEMLHGRMVPAERLSVIERFRQGEIRVLVSKASLLGYGMNFQFCRAMVFSGWDDSYERFYQAVRRAYRFGQTETVHVHIPYIEELEGPILKNVLRKKASFEADTEQQERYYNNALKGVHAL